MSTFYNVEFDEPSGRFGYAPIPAEGIDIPESDFIYQGPASFAGWVADLMNQAVEIAKGQDDEKEESLKVIKELFDNGFRIHALMVNDSKAQNMFFKSWRDYEDWVSFLEQDKDETFIQFLQRVSKSLEEQ